MHGVHEVARSSRVTPTKLDIWRINQAYFCFQNVLVLQKRHPLKASLMFYRIKFYVVAFVCLVVVRMHLVQTFFLPTFCRLIYWRLSVLIFEWLRLAPFVGPRPHTSHLLDIYSFNGLLDY